MTIHIAIKTDNKTEAESAFQLVSYLNQLDMKGEIHAIWADPKPMAITIDWSDKVDVETVNMDHLKIKEHIE